MSLMVVTVPSYSAYKAQQSVPRFVGRRAIRHRAGTRGVMMDVAPPCQGYPYAICQSRFRATIRPSNGISTCAPPFPFRQLFEAPLAPPVLATPAVAHRTFLFCCMSQLLSSVRRSSPKGLPSSEVHGHDGMKMGLTDGWTSEIGSESWWSRDFTRDPCIARNLRNLRSNMQLTGSLC